MTDVALYLNMIIISVKHNNGHFVMRDLQEYSYTESERKRLKDGITRKMIQAYNRNLRNKEYLVTIPSPDEFRDGVKVIRIH